jgi:hypothetical protein
VVIEAFTTPDIEYRHARRVERTADANAWIDRDNAGWLADRAGFVREGVLRGSALHADGFHDMVLYSHLADEPVPPS